MFNLANLLTAANLMSGIIAILLSLTGFVSYAPFALFLGAFFDFLDGLAARMFKTSGELGKQLDSLADMVTFGVAPGVVMMVLIALVLFGGDANSTRGLHVWMSEVVRGNPHAFLPFIALVLPFFALFRLAKFNLDIRQTESFIGLPTPACTLFFMSFPLSLGFAASETAIDNLLFHPLFLSALMLIFGFLMVSEIPLFSLKLKHFGWKGNELRYLFLLISLVFILLFLTWSLALIVFLYLILSFVENTFLKRNRNEV